MTGFVWPIRWSLCLFIAILPGESLAFADQAAIPKAETQKAPETKPAPVDPRFQSPKATVRTFLTLMNLVEENPERIDETIACLDLSELPPERREGGKLAFNLELILRSLKIPTFVIPDHVEGPKYTLGDKPDLQVSLRRMPDGRWLFDGETLKAMPQLRLALHRRSLEVPERKEASDVPAAFRSPRALVTTLMEAMKKGDHARAGECLDLEEIPAPGRRLIGGELAMKLKEILDRNSFVIFQDIPDSPLGDPMTALVRKEGRIVAERQTDGKRKGQWLINQATVDSLDRLYDVFESKPIVPELAAIGFNGGPPPFSLSPGLWFRHRVPSWLKAQIEIAGRVSLASYQLVGLVVLALLVVPLYRLTTASLAPVARGLFRWRGDLDEVAEVPGFIRPIGWLLVIWFLIFGISLLDLPHELLGSIYTVLVPAYDLAATLALYRLIDPILRFVSGTAGERQDVMTLTAMGFPVIALVLKILVLAVGLSIVLELFDFDVTTVLAGLGIGGLAFALAAQDTLKNFFGSVMLIADRTFRIGDLVKIGSNLGTVEAVGLRSTRIRGLDDSLLTIPNSDLTTEHVTNFGARRHRRFETRIRLPYTTSPERLIELRDGCLALLQSQANIKRDACEAGLNALDESGVEILIRTFLEVPNGREELIARNRLNLELLRLIDQLGIEPMVLEKSDS